MAFIRIAAALLVLAASLCAQSNPVPFINNPLVPDAMAPGGAQFTITINGSGFVSGSTVNWNGVGLPTTFVSESQLTAVVPSSNISVPGTASVTVTNPGVGSASNTGFFQVAAPTAGVALSNFGTFSETESFCNTTADLNKDGKVDLVTCGASDTVEVYLGNGDGTFATPVDYIVGSFPGQVLVADFNGDGKLDLVVAASGGPWILLGNGDGTFGPSQSTNDSLFTYMAAGDFNDDGDLDLAISDASTNQVAIVLGKGDGTFEKPVFYPAQPTTTGIAIGDFNRDGKLDVAAAARFTDFIDVFLGNGDGTLQPFVAYPSASQAISAVVGDVNADGILDLVVGTVGPAYSVLLGNGDGSFQEHVDYRTPTTISSGLTLQDFNGDGKLDTALTGGISYFLVGLGNGDGTFQNPIYSSVGNGLLATSFSLGDFNSDGAPDALVGGGSLSVLLQVPSVLSRTFINFGKVKVGTSTSPVRVILSNTGLTTFFVSNVQVTGNAQTSFAQSNNCKRRQVLPGGTCSVDVIFTPMKSGSLQAMLTVRDSGAYAQQSVMLLGTGQ